MAGAMAAGLLCNILMRKTYIIIDVCKRQLPIGNFVLRPSDTSVPGFPSLASRCSAPLRLTCSREEIATESVPIWVPAAALHRPSLH
jgi:hypothetical protein